MESRPSAQEILALLEEWKESQGLDEHHWQRKDAIKAYFAARKCSRIRDPLNESERRWLKYLSDDGEDLTPYLTGCIVYRCDSCTNVTGTPPVIYGFVSEARAFGCKHRLRRQRQYEFNGKVWWIDTPRKSSAC